MSYSANAIHDAITSNKAKCVYNSYMSDLSVLISVGIFILYGISVRNGMNKQMTTYAAVVNDIPMNYYTLGLFLACAICIFYSAVNSFVVNETLIGSQYILYGIGLTGMLYELRRPENEHYGISPLYFIPITIALFFHNIVESYKNRKCNI